VLQDFHTPPCVRGSVRNGAAAFFFALRIVQETTSTVMIRLWHCFGVFGEAVWSGFNSYFGIRFSEAAARITTYFAELVSRRILNVLTRCADSKDCAGARSHGAPALRSSARYHRESVMSKDNQSLSAPLVEIGRRFRSLLGSPVDAASLAVFRICFGLVMVWEAYKYLVAEGGTNRIQRLFSQQHWHFPYHGFEWVTPWSETGMHIHFWVLGTVGFLFAVGLFYRVAAAAVFVAFTYIFLLDSALYLNHFYLMCLLSFLMIWLPANRCWSVDAWWKRRKQSKSLSGVPLASPVPGERKTLATEDAGKSSGTRSNDSLISFWPVFLLRAQLFIVYFYAGIAKLGADWLSGEALAPAHQRVYDYLSGAVTLPAWLTVQKIGLAMNWCGMLFDLAIGFLLVCRRTRLLGIALMLVFHTVNHFVFPIGVFPVMAFTASLIFFDPDWPRCVISWLRRPRFSKPDLGWLVGGALAVPVVGATLGWKRKSAQSSFELPAARLRGVVIAFVSLWVVAQCLLPLRHFFVPGNAEWTAEHHRFSWRMMLKSKSALNVNFDVTDRELLDFNKHGKPAIDWAKWPNDQPRVMHMIVTAHAVPWKKLPNTVFVYEPYVGYRIIENPWAEQKPGDGSVKARSQAVQDHWKESIGRKPTIHSTVSLDEALKRLKKGISRLSATGDQIEEKEYQINRIGRILEIDQIKNRTVEDMIEFSDLIEMVVSSQFGGDLAQKELRRTHPFAVQGARCRRSDFLVVSGPAVQHDSALQQMAKLNDEQPFIVLVDTNRLRDAGWQGLPKMLMLLDLGRPRLTWNCFPDLHTHQVQVMTKNPYMIHQYANRIADTWQSETGRRPEVRALAAAKMNKHKPQLIIDPKVDLASTSLSVLGHSPWIYHLHNTEALQKPTSVAQATRRPGSTVPGQVMARTSQREILERYPSGQPKQGIQWNGSKQDYTVVRWHENGQVAMLAQYKDNQPHGKQLKWSPEGELILEMHFENGEPHGIATSWTADGKLAEKVEFFEGRQVNHEGGSNSSTVPAVAETIESSNASRR